MTVILAGTKENGTDEYRNSWPLRSGSVNLIEYSDFIPGRCELVIDAGIFGMGRPEVRGVLRDLLGPRFSAVGRPGGGCGYPIRNSRRYR